MTDDRYRDNRKIGIAHDDAASVFQEIQPSAVLDIKN